MQQEIRRSLVDEVSERSGTMIRRCYHCGSCANGSPFIQALDYPPNAVLLLLQFGMRQEALGHSVLMDQKVCLPKD